MTAMESLEQMGAVAPGIPRFDDGMVNLRELIRLMAEALVNEIMDAQADEACAEGNQRNGYRERTLVTSVGPITLRIPKLRVGSYFPEDLLVRYSRVDRAVIAAVSEMVTNGVSTRKVEKAAHAMGIGRMSASQVSRICESLDAVVEDLQTRVFGELRFPYLWLDATYLKCRDAGHASPTALVTATACGDDGYRRLVGLDAIDTESYLGWRGFLQSLRSRGVDGVVLVWVRHAHIMRHLPGGDGQISTRMWHEVDTVTARSRPSAGRVPAQRRYGEALSLTGTVRARRRRTEHGPGTGMGATIRPLATVSRRPRRPGRCPRTTRREETP